MAYLLEENGEGGEMVVLGEPIHDLVVARVIAARRAARMRKVVVVRDGASRLELARFDGKSYTPTRSIERMRAVGR